jgi:hypothetical protein
MELRNQDLFKIFILLAENGITDEMKTILRQGDIILDCLPGMAPRIAQFASKISIYIIN